MKIEREEIKEIVKKENNFLLEKKEVEANIEISYANEEEVKRLEKFELQHKEQAEALKRCSKVFNENCRFPWYIIGSISFLINVEESKKQPEDIDIIFHENDFDVVVKKFKKIEGLKNYKSGIAYTGCRYIKGEITINEKTVEVEAFSQSTKEKNGIINPGTIKDNGDKYHVIRNKLAGSESFNILDKEGQIELYFKNLISELSVFEFGVIAKEDELKIEDKSIKFINRLANLFELGGNNPFKLKNELSKKCSSHKERLLLKALINIIEEFIKKDNEGEGLVFKYNDGHVQVAIENLKKIMKEKKEEMESKFIELQEIAIRQPSEIIKLEKDMINWINEILKSDEVINSKEGNKDLPLFVLTTMFKIRQISPFIKKLKKSAQYGKLHKHVR